MAVRRLSRALLWTALLLAAPAVLYKVTERIIASRLGYDSTAPTRAPPVKPRGEESAIPAEAPPRPQARAVSPTKVRAIALVVRGLGPRGVDPREALDSPLPLTLAIEPFTPFALRISREAAKKHKEVLVDLPAPELLTPPEYLRTALTALWWPSGVLLDRPDYPLPVEDIERHGALLYDLSQPGPVDRRTPRVTLDAQLTASGPSASPAHDPALMWVTAAELPGALRWLSASGARPLFASEALIARLGAQNAIPRRD